MTMVLNYLVSKILISVSSVRLPHPYPMSANAGDLDLTLGSKQSPEKGMATQSSILAWKIPWTEETGRLQSMGSQRVGHHSVTNTSTFHALSFILFFHLEHSSPLFSYLLDLPYLFL